MSHYQTLGVRQGANPIEILSAYKALQDAHADGDIETQLEINLAYQTLIHPGRRSEYDREFDSTQIRAESTPVKLQPVQTYQTSQHVTHNHYVSVQPQTTNNPLTNFFLCLILTYCAGTVLLMVLLAW